MPDLRFDVLPPAQRALWKELAAHAADLSDGGYYLAGGTALALQIGHRQSVDFDFFSMKKEQAASTISWAERLTGWVLRDRDPHTIDGEAHGAKISFISAYKYPHVGDFLLADGIAVAAVEDIALMKLLAITHRAVIRDYIDLAAVLRDCHALSDLLALMDEKYGAPPDRMLVLRALVTFTDLEPEMPHVLDTDLAASWQSILRAAVKEVARR